MEIFGLLSLLSEVGLIIHDQNEKTKFPLRLKIQMHKDWEMTELR